MRNFILVGFCAIACSIASSQTAAVKVPVLGTWEGESKCMVPLPCRDEHVIYDISLDEQQKIAIKADKVVNGERLYMGTLTCTWSDADKRLTCPVEGRRPGVWVFDLKDDTLVGTATLRAGNELFRRVNVKRRD